MTDPSAIDAAKPAPVEAEDGKKASKGSLLWRELKGPVRRLGGPRSPVPAACGCRSWPRWPAYGR